MMRTPARSVRLALIAYRDDGSVLQMVPLGTVAKPLPIVDLLNQVRARIGSAGVAHVLKFNLTRKTGEP